MSGMFPPSPMVSSSSGDRARRRADRILMQLREIDWENKTALEYVSTMVAIPELGLPDVFDETKGGCAIWRHRQLYGIDTHAIKVCDECIPVQCLKGTCCGFAYVAIPFDAASCSCADEMINISKHVIVDVGKKVVKARGDSLEMCLAILAIFTGTAKCRARPEDVKKSQAFDKAILLAKASPEDFRKLAQSVAENTSRA